MSDKWLWRILIGSIALMAVGNLMQAASAFAKWMGWY